MTTTLAAQNLTAAYDPRGKIVLNGISVEFDRGELVGIVGPNGCGKSTLLRSLSRTLRPIHGAALLDGQDLYTLPARLSARAIGVVPQAVTIAFDFTVREIVQMGRSPRMSPSPFASLTPADHRVVEEALQETGLLPLADRIANTLSGGELQRVLLARALAQEPNILLLDEPTGHLDILHQIEVLGLVRRMAHRQDGRCIVAVLHDLNQAAAYCDRIILMKSGAVFASGGATEVLTEENILAVYGARVRVRENPGSGRPFILTLPGEEDGAEAFGSDAGRMGQGANAASLRVHIVCGGGTGLELMTALQAAGCRISAGPLNAGDSDYEAASSLGIRIVREAPFTPISAKALNDAERLAAEADVLLITDVPFGPGNVCELDLALVRRLAGQPVWLWLVGAQSADLPEPRDFTGGSASEKWRRLVEAGAAPIRSWDHLRECVRMQEEKIVVH